MFLVPGVSGRGHGFGVFETFNRTDGPLPNTEHRGTNFFLTFRNRMARSTFFEYLFSFRGITFSLRCRPDPQSKDRLARVFSFCLSFLCRGSNQDWTHTGSPGLGMRTLINLCVTETWPGRSTPIAYTHDHGASKGIAKGNPDQVPDCSRNGNPISVIRQKRHRKYSHVCDAVFNTVILLKHTQNTVYRLCMRKLWGKKRLSAWFYWRRVPESNRCTRICNGMYAFK